MGSRKVVASSTVLLPGYSVEKRPLKKLVQGIVYSAPYLAQRFSCVIFNAGISKALSLPCLLLTTGSYTEQFYSEYVSSLPVGCLQ
jgi:hypothetical protein